MLNNGTITWSDAHLCLFKFEALNHPEFKQCDHMLEYKVFHLSKNMPKKLPKQFLLKSNIFQNRYFPIIAKYFSFYAKKIFYMDFLKIA